MIGIICDSMADAPKEIIKKHSIEVVPGLVVLGDETYKDGVEIGEEKVVEFMKTKIPKTSLPLYSDIKDSFMKLIDNGCDEIIAINISNGLSGTHGIFKMIANELKDQFKNIKIEVIDSLSVGIGSGLLIYKAAKLVEEKMDFETIVETLKDYLQNKIKVFYTIPTLKFLKAGGRIGRVSATIGEILNIKPVISVGKDGVYHTVAKSRGMKKSVSDMIGKFKEFIHEKEVEVVSIARTGDAEATLNSVNRIIEEVKKLNVTDMFVDKINASLLVHTGIGLVGIAVLVK